MKAFNNFTSAAGSHARIMELEDFCFSDFHKDVYGFRPRGETWDRFVNMPVDTLIFCVDNMFRIMDESQKAEEVREAEALESFKADLQNLMASGAGDWKTALKWMMEETEEDNVEYFLWSLGIGHAKRNEIVELFFAK